MTERDIWLPDEAELSALVRARLAERRISLRMAEYQSGVSKHTIRNVVLGNPVFAQTYRAIIKWLLS